jgi:ribosomal protein S18 acetylase RimI-like enzyme
MAYFSQGVHNDYQRKGLGTFLLRRISKILVEEAGCTSVGLHVKAQNSRAVNLYKRNGFVVEEELEDFYCINERRYNALKMKQTFVKAEPLWQRIWHCRLLPSKTS